MNCVLLTLEGVLRQFQSMSICSIYITRYILRIDITEASFPQIHILFSILYFCGRFNMHTFSAALYFLIVSWAPVISSSQSSLCPTGAFHFFSSLCLWTPPEILNCHNPTLGSVPWRTGWVNQTPGLHRAAGPLHATATDVHFLFILSAAPEK